MFFCEFCKISKNAFSYITPPVAASEVYEKNSFTYSFSCILLSFSKNASRLLLPRGFESVRAKFLSGLQAKGSARCNFLFNYDPFWMRHLTLLLVVLSTVFLKKWEFIAIQRLQKHSFFLSLCVLICTFDKRLIALHHGESNFVLKSVSNSRFKQ